MITELREKMKHLKYIFMAFAVLLLAASCSQDELLEDGGIEEVPVTFTATVDYAIETQEDDTAGNMKQAVTRATFNEDDAPTRFYAQAVSNGTLSEVVEGIKNDDGTYSFTLQVAKGTEYDYMFWADNAPTGDEPTDLRSVSYTMGDIAFAAKEQGTPETVNKDVKLQHVVAKVTLKTTTDITFEYSRTISLSASCASTYNVQTPSASSFEDKSISKEMTGASLAADSEVLTTYIIPNPDDKAVTFSAHDLAQTIDVVHLVANTNVTLQGDLSEDNPKWGATKEYVEKQIDFFFKNENGDYQFYLPEEKIIDLEAVLSAIFHKNVGLDLTKNYYIFKEVLDDNYTSQIFCMNEDLTVAYAAGEGSNPCDVPGRRKMLVTYGPIPTRWMNLAAAVQRPNADFLDALWNTVASRNEFGYMISAKPADVHASRENPSASDVQLATRSEEELVFVPKAVLQDSSFKKVCNLAENHVCLVYMTGI